MDNKPRCQRCEDVIGVYEAMVVLENDQARHTSRALERQGLGLAAECYHRACYATAHGAPRAGPPASR